MFKLEKKIMYSILERKIGTLRGKWYNNLEGN